MEEIFFGELSVIAMKGCEKFAAQVDYYLKDSSKRARQVLNESFKGTFITETECIRFATGEGKGVIKESLRGHDVYIISDVFNYSMHYKMRGEKHFMSPDEHFQDLKRIIGAIAGKARRISVIMPMLYEGRQHKRQSRESLDCAVALQELVGMGVANIITFDAHDVRVQNAIPLKGFDDVEPTYQMVKALVRNVPDISLSHEDIMIVSPDEGGMKRCMYYSSILKLDLGMFYKRRDYAVVDESGKNPIVAHEYLGKSVAGKDVIVVDDMISSGESIFTVAEYLKSKGAKRIFAFITFGLFCDGLEKFDLKYKSKVFDRIFTTNLVYQPPELFEKEWYTEVNLCKYVAFIIDTLNCDTTISELLNPVNRITDFLATEYNKKK